MAFADPREVIKAAEGALPWEHVVLSVVIPAYNEVRTVESAARRALERARADGGPTLLECMTYRLVGHSRSDPATYRKPGELERWHQRDPLVLARAALIQEQGIGEDALAALEEAVEREVGAAFDATLEAPFPQAEEVAHA